MQKFLVVKQTSVGQVTILGQHAEEKEAILDADILLKSPHALGVNRLFIYTLSMIMEARVAVVGTRPEEQE